MGRPSRFTFLALKFSSVMALSACATTARTADKAPTDATTAITENTDEGSLEELSDGGSKAAEAPSRKTAANEASAASDKETSAATSSRPRPQLMLAPVEIEGFWVNAAYFPHSPQETWNSISDKLYGRPDRVALLKKWNNGARIRVGEPIYYNSPSRPDDKDHLKVFAEDFGYKLEEFTVRKGDSLSKIGELKLGDLRTWKELAAINPEIANPDVIEVGQVIHLPPREVDTHPVLQNIIKEVTKAQQQTEQVNQVVQNNQVPAAEPTAQPATQPAVAQTAAVGQVAQNSSNSEMPPPSAPVAPALSLNKPSSESKLSNLFGMGGALLLITAAGMVIYRRLIKFRAAKTRAHS